MRLIFLVMKKILLSNLGAIFSLLVFCLPPFLDARADDGQNKKEEIREELEEIEQDLENKKNKEFNLQTELEKIEKNINNTKQSIDQTNRVVQKFQQEITQKEKSIAEMEKNIEAKKKSLSQSLREFRQNYQEIELIFLNSRNDLGSYFNFLEQIEKIQIEFEKIINQIKGEKSIIEKEKDVVEEKKDIEHKTLLLHQQQKKSLESQEASKEFYLNQTREKIDLLNTRKEDLRRQLNALQSLGKAINLEEAIEEAKYASVKTGVRTEFLLGVLRVESNLGQNIGGGTYKADMNPNQHDTFEEICDDLGYKAKKMPVSKRVCYNPKAKDSCGGWGGAMGPAQFMPSTWLGYKDKVADITGNSPADPWDLRDSLVAMGLKLSAISGVTNHKESAEKKAAAMYLAGGAWENYSWYGDRVLDYADMFEKYIEEN